MDPEARELLQENNKMLHKILRAQRWSQFSSALRWVFLIAVTLAGYYFAQPYLDQLFDLYDQVSGQISQVKSLLPNNPF